jgi:phytoene dehydrogenase-like protein
VAKRFDCIVIGAGHNGLVCAAQLARAGRSVLVVEAAAVVGGAAGTREFSPGYRVSGAAHLLHAVPAALIRELQLEQHGLRWAVRGLGTAMLSPDAAPVLVGAGLPPDEAQALQAFEARLRRLASTLAATFAAPPPRLGTADWVDRWSLLRMAFKLRALGRRDMRELLRIVGMNVFDLLQEHLASTALQGAFALDAVLGANLGPRSPGTVLTLLYRLAAEEAAWDTGLSIPLGGMGALSNAIASAAIAAGAEVRTGSAVASILVEGDRAAGVQLGSGETFGARCVISNADPKTTFLRLLGARHLDAGFVRRLTHLRTQGLAAKVHLALDRPPSFGLAAGAQNARLLLAPSVQYVERAYNHAKYGEISAEPVMEITLPSLYDDTLAPAGHHVLSAIVQFAPYTLKQGWESGREQLLQASLGALERVAPGIGSSVVHAEVLAPPDLEREFGATGGHWHHADFAFDQFYFARPLPGAAQYRTPLPGLYLCGAGCHPGGGVMGVAGRNAAAAVLAVKADEAAA